MDEFSKLISRHEVDAKRTLITRADGGDLSRRWAIAASKGAFSRWHIDASGYATLIHMWEGAKVWIFFIRSGQASFMFDRETEEGEEIRCVPLLLLPGDQL
jgi:hypothetical protein